MDFSLLQTESRHYALRDILALKERWPYYVIMVLDPILRFSWIFYAIFTHNTQHSTIVSFLVSLCEVSRRGMWALFRVENEHCANVSQYKASRDVPLPYRIEPLMGRASAESSPTIESHGDTDTESQPAGRRPQVPQSTSSSTAVASTLGTLRRRTDASSHRSFSKILAAAHKQDFEKRRKPGAEGADVEEQSERSDDDEDDDDFDQDEADILLEAGRAGESRRTEDTRRRHR